MSNCLRADEGLAFMLRYENVAWYDNGLVRILDRRVYPRKVELVECRTHLEVTQAIRDMVTQSAGPYMAAAMGMALAAYECRDKSADAQLAYLRGAADTISHARPTTTGRMLRITAGCLQAAEIALQQGADVSAAIVAHTVDVTNIRYSKVNRIAEHLVDLFPDNGKILTQCFAETIVGMMLKVAKERGKQLKLFCAETRPYFQGARLTATVCSEMGFDTTLITDNMPAFVIENEGIDVFTSAADAICMDGHVVNKVGTYQIAIVAKQLGVPYFVTGAPDVGHKTRDDIVIEMRDPDFVLEAMGVRTAADGVKGYYPAFDITPPALVSGVVTDRGIFTPYNLPDYFSDGDIGEFEMII